MLKACLNWAVAHGYLDTNPAAHVTVTVHGARTPEWFRTPADFWTTLDHIDAAHAHALHDAFVARPPDMPSCPCRVARRPRESVRA